MCEMEKTDKKRKRGGELEDSGQMPAGATNERILIRRVKKKDKKTKGRSGGGHLSGNMRLCISQTYFRFGHKKRCYYDT